MGEARRRKEADPPLGRSKRGLILGSPTEVDLDRNRVKVRAGIDPQELRFATLYWDRLAWPSSRAIFIGGGPDEDYLQKVGILSRPDHTFYGVMADTVARSYIAAFQALDEKEPGQWSVSLGENTLQIFGGTLADSPAFSPASNLQVDLIRSIPVPDKDVPLAEVLEFKRKRRDELERLREELDKLQDFVKSGPNQVAALEKAKQEIDRACADAIRVAFEWQWPVRLTGSKCTFECKPIDGIIAAMSTHALGLPLTQAALAGLVPVAASAIKFSFDGVSWRGLKPRRSPFNFVARYHMELF
jgi:hypothetical protein